MKAVIQRVSGATLTAEGREVSRIGNGLVVFFCVEREDPEPLCARFADKLAKLRIFEDGAGKMNLSVTDVGGEVLLVSQFTLAADLRHGNRPSFTEAEQPERAKELYLRTADLLRDRGIPTQLGIFGADMTVSQHNAGPVTVIWEER